MMRWLTVLVGLCALLVGVHATWALGERIVVIREDDGEMDGTRGQVSSPTGVLKKVLSVEYEPEEMRSAQVMYLMKINPYHVGTRSLHGAPAEGIEWNNLLIRVNDQEVLRGSLIEYATAGWHEVEIPPEVLRLGDNEIAFTLDKPGGYFYMAVDDSSPLGHSAASGDGGHTFVPGSVNPGGTVPESGEFMVRLKLEVSTAPRPQIELHDGHGYGWLEVEDLFSRTRRHEGGWLAIPWTRGENAPSRDLTAHTQQDSSFSYAFDLPQAGAWFVWWRGWEDGHYGGYFKLAWDSEEFFDSRGKADFTSDGKLRFEWLKAGPVELTEGQHTLTYTVMGACGHMADVLILTTDPDFVPDETAPLRRMPVPEKLVPPEGVADMAPGLFHDQPPIPWATPLAGEPLRTLWVCGNTQAREILEISRRLDMKMDVVTYQTTYLGSNVFGGDLNLDKVDLIYELLMSPKQYNVVVLVRVKYDQIPEHVWKPLLDRVEKGMGLIIVNSKRAGEPPPRLADALKELERLDFPALESSVDLKGLASNRVAHLGEGWVVNVSYTLFGMMDRIGQAPEDLHYTWWEDQFSRWIKLLLTASGRQDARPKIIAFSVPETTVAGAEVKTTVEVEGGEANSHRVSLEWTVRGPFDAFEQKGQLPAFELVPATSEISIALPVSSEGGMYRAVLRLLDEQGRVLDFAAGHFEAKSPLALAALALPEEPIQPNGTLPLTFSFTNAGEVAQPARVELEVYGAYQRLLARKDFGFNIAPGESEQTREIALLSDAGILATAHARLFNAQGELVGRAAARVLVKQPVVYDDIHLETSAFDNKEMTEYLNPIYVRLWQQIGADLLYPGMQCVTGNDFGMRCALAFRMTASGFPASEEEGVRNPCIHDPAFWEKEEPALREAGRNLARWSPLALGLADEMRLGDTEVCFSEYTLGEFRAHLLRTYQNLNRLNQVWQTDFASWDEVSPWRVARAIQRPENIAPWLDFRVFMAQSYVDWIVRMMEAVREGAPGIPVGGVNPVSENHVLGGFFSLLMPRLDYAQSYPRFYDWARSWFGVPRHAWTWTGYDRSAGKIADECWMVPTFGGTMIGLYGVNREGYQSLTDTLGLGPRAQWIGEITPALTQGPGKLVMEAEVEPEPVAILKSYRSKIAVVALWGAASGETNPYRWAGEFDRFIRGYAALLQVLKINYRFVDEDQVERGELAKYRALIMPECVSLSDAALDRVEAFMKEGNVVVRDDDCGKLDEHGVSREGGLPTRLATDAVIFPASPPRATLENTILLGEAVAAAGLTSPETFSDNVGRVVRKHLGDIRILVLFGAGEMTVGLPAPTFCYDVRHHQFLGYTNSPTLLAEHGPALLALSPYEVAGLQLRVTPTASPGQEVTCQVAVQATSGECATHVVRVEVTDPAGQPRPAYAANLLAFTGHTRATFTLALNDPLGTWQVRALDVMSGKTAEAQFEVKQ